MRFSTFALLTSAITAVNAYFRLAYPPPRGPFDMENEVNFCGNVARFSSIRVLTFAADNYVDAVDNRTDGYITLRSGHPNRDWNLCRPGTGANLSVPSDVSCTNATSPTNTTNSTTNSNSTGSKSGTGGITATGYAGALGFLIALLTA
ncbi:hypothetical protein F5888DRAFT_1688361 [Russula emetica]|nr:hypothetical protein F5888DRAFT_1688361 [Russula emetica]